MSHPVREPTPVPPHSLHPCRVLRAIGAAGRADFRTRRRGHWVVWLAFTATLPLLPGCLLLAGRGWDDTRKTVIEPINSTVHRHLPRDIKAKDLDAIVEVYATDTGTGLPWNDPVAVPGDFSERRLRWQGPAAAEPIRERYAHLLGLFDTIDKAEVRIHRVYWDARDPRGFPADLHLIVRGVSSGGDHLTLDQRSRVWIDQRGGKWVLTGEEVTARELVSTGQPRFQLATEAAGIRDTHDASASPPFRLIGKLAAASGVAVGDFDCDGFEDIALLSTNHLALYRNRADGTFTDVTATSGLPATFDIAGTGLVFFDADNDGDPDLWVCGIRGERFYRNEACGRFVDATEAAGLKPSRWASMPIVADYDRDGFLDVYVTHMGDYEKTAPVPTWQARNGLPDRLYHNNGDGTFTDATDAAGIDDTGWGLAAAWGDYDNDGYPDVYVGNEFGFHTLYRNNRDGTFTHVTRQAGALDRGAAMGIAWGDYDNDGNLDLFISKMYANSRWALFHPDFPPPVPWYLSWVPRADIDQVTEEVTRGNTLLRNNGDGTFSDVSDQSGVRDTQWSWGAEFLDYNNDGRLDIYAANGFITGPLPDDV
jgi:hypothetical protein